MLLFLIIACSEPDKDLFVGAIKEANPDSCEAIGDITLKAECIATIVRDNNLGGSYCDTISGKWAYECNFSVAETLARIGNRWGALERCGQAGKYMDECLFHLWTLELALIASNETRIEHLLEKGNEAVEFWSQVQTAGPNQRSRVEDDLFNAWWQIHKPADLQKCLLTEQIQICERATAVFVERAIDAELRAKPELLDRTCRAEKVPKVLLERFAQEDEILEEAADRARARICVDPKAKRPWNPIFQPRSPG